MPDTVFQNELMHAAELILQADALVIAVGTGTGRSAGVEGGTIECDAEECMI
ncbi:MAG: hypothetical protein GZ093_07365 [Rhodoferax sp.]|uniref:hypothetical protein n=1 Tax=Rhodoferax sp. TaxID=50421 RepID=UPI0013FF938F|nr:hypothetical protein [Rhodoferax sp.]NDP38556.1 hypothetical protein [Rhodoferax sp.]